MRERLVALGNALGKQPHLMSVRDGVVGSLPLILLGSLFLLLARRLGPDKTVVTILPDTGERYFSLDEYFA